MFTQGVNSEGELIRDFYVVHDAVDLCCPPEEGMTRQEFRDECDINVLMATYERNGRLDHINRMQPQYLDVSDVPDLPRAIAIMDEAQRAFMTLPASTRREFDQDPVKFVDFAMDPANLSRMREWGLAPPAVVADAPIPSGGSTPPPADKGPA